MKNKINSTTDYDDFKIMHDNRDTSRGHIEALKNAFEEVGNLTSVQPILVNDKMQIIDGQHRFQAAKELGVPVYYTVVPGLGIEEARSMNILHRNWTVEDYAKSYSEEGNPNYIMYNRLKEDYPFSHSTIIAYTDDGERGKSIFKSFREGKYEIDDIRESTKRLDALVELREAGGLTSNRSFARAVLHCLRNPEYSNKHMARKLKLHPQYIRSLTTVEDNLRMLEEIYNFQMHEENRIRLY